MGNGSSGSRPSESAIGSRRKAIREFFQTEATQPHRLISELAGGLRSVGYVQERGGLGFPEEWQICRSWSWLVCRDAGLTENRIVMAERR